MCLFPLFAGPIEIPLVPASPLYAWRRSIGFWLRVVSFAHLLLSVAWFTCFQIIMGAADLIFSQFGIWSVSSTSHNVYLLVFYFAACVVQATFMAVIFTIRMLGMKWKSWIELAPWQAEMDFVLVCVGFFLYLTAATLACLTLMAASADEMGRQAAWDRDDATQRVRVWDPFGRPPANRGSGAAQHEPTSNSNGGANANSHAAASGSSASVNVSDSAAADASETASLIDGKGE